MIPSNLLSMRFLFAGHLLLLPSSYHARPLSFLILIYPVNHPVCTCILSSSLHHSSLCRASPPSSFIPFPFLINSPFFLPSFRRTSFTRIETTPCLYPPSRHSPLNRPPRHSYLYSLFWVLCRLKVYLGPTVLCIRTYTHDLHVYRNLFSRPLALFIHASPLPLIHPALCILMYPGGTRIRQKTDGIKIGI